MVKKSYLMLAVLAVFAIAGIAVAHTGGTAGNPPITDAEWTDNLDTQSFTHLDAAPFKGWWIVTIKNSTATAWSSMLIQSGQTDLVAIVQGTGMSDEFGYTNDSVTGTRAGAVSYADSLGTRDYGGGNIGNLWKSATYTFTSPVTTGQSAKFYVYTDNSYYTGPFATQFSVTLTPNAVPEPGAFFALSAGLIGLVGVIKRRRN